MKQYAAVVALAGLVGIAAFLPGRNPTAKQPANATTLSKPVAPVATTKPPAKVTDADKIKALETKLAAVEAKLSASESQNIELRGELTAIKSAPVIPQLTKEQAARKPQVAKAVTGPVYVQKQAGLFGRRTVWVRSK